MSLVAGFTLFVDLICSFIFFPGFFLFLLPLFFSFLHFFALPRFFAIFFFIFFIYPFRPTSSNQRQHPHSQYVHHYPTCFHFRDRDGDVGQG